MARPRRVSILSCALAPVAFAAALAFGEAPRAETLVGSGVAKTETREVGSFHAIELSAPARVVIRQGGREGVTITGDDNIVPRLTTVVERGVLKIRFDRHESLRYDRLALVVEAKRVDGIAIEGSGSVHSERLAGARLDATIGGSGQIVIDALEADVARASIAGSGTMDLAGRANTLAVSISGSGEVDAAKLEARETKADVQGSGRVHVWATDKLQATIAGSGEVVYTGTPAVRKTVAGSGSVSAAR